MRLWPIIPEILQDLRQRVRWHGDLQEIVQEWDNGVVGAGLAAEELWDIFAGGRIGELRLVDHAVGKHGLGGNAKDEGAVVEVLFGLGVGPHELHGSVDAVHGGEHGAEGLGDAVDIGVGGRASGRNAFEEIDCAGDERTGGGDHVDVCQDETGFRRGWVEALFEGTDQTEVGVDVCAEFGVNHGVVSEGVSGCVAHEGWDVESKTLDQFIIKRQSL